MGQPTLQDQIGEWGRVTFDAKSTLVHKKLKQEFEEFNKALDTLHELNHHRYFVITEAMEAAYSEVEDEAADIVTLLFQIADVCDFDLIAKVKEKFEINKARTWLQNPDGTFQHAD